ncbi:pilus assembly protein [Variovorax sp. DXTD-1]|uniref:pilus assembly protein n=1 Tax=Variovorax sp. DXTD-1 TaxID=2495592 RepID=UPI000F866616|nr:PilC/PilY family type IV pilus protein [Variovorax sp. DXTD-1]RST53970.1 pilus assembly protein PilY [Variovorax sp. DXTD-1]
MKKNFFRPLWAAALLMFGFSAAQAEDIDLFVGYNQTVTDAPNVLFVLDNTANWNQPFTAEINALASAFESLPTGKFKVGVMMFSETGGGNSNIDGAYLRAGVRLLDEDNRRKYGALIRSLDKLDDKSNGGKAGKMMAEVYRYLSSGAPMGGNNKAKADYTGNVFGTAASKAIYSLPGNPLAAINSSTYTGPNTTNCIGTYVIYISNGAAQDNNSDTTTSTNALRAAGGTTTMIPLSPSGSQDNVADEWAKFLQTSMGVKVYTVEAAKATGGQGPGWSALLKSMADQSKGEYYDLSAKVDLGLALKESLDDIFSKIQSVNSVFSSVSLPVSVNTQGTYLNQVFVGMFRPDDSAYPRWNGNLKQYKLGLDTNNQLILQDAAGTNAINNQTGFIAPCARSFWTPAPSTTDAYWSFRPAGDCLGKEAAESPDGNVVEKGAQGYMLRQVLTADRNVKTCAADDCSILTSFATGNTAGITKEALGVPTDAERTALIEWLRGLDNKGDERRAADGTPLTSTTAMRPSVHGDVVHSRPVAINYGSDSEPQVVVFYGANDGMLRAVNGNQTAAIGSAAPGSEMWSFVPPEFYGSIKRLYDNTKRINFPGVPVSVGATAPKPYGMDGAMAAYRQGNEAWLYASMRRGGRLVYAFDVSNPASPILKWRRGCPNQDNDVGCDTGANDMTGIGQTWSAPKIVKSAGYGSGSTPMVMFGGGYDKCEDVDTTDPALACGAASKGKKIYVLDASTGTVLQTFTTERAVAGEVTVVNDSAGLAKIAYAADLGGNVYRIAIGAAAPGSWTMTKIASLGCDVASTTCTPNRKFMFGPDVVEDNGMNVLLLGSGDREKPLRSYTAALSVSNRFYMMVDKPADATWLTNESSNCDGNSLLCHGSLLAITGTDEPSPTALAAKKGWYLVLAPGEQVVTSSVTAYGNTTFNTHTPTDPTVRQSCRADLGTANVYNLAYLNAGAQGARFQNVVGGGLAPSPVVGRVMVNGSFRDVVIGANPDSFLSPKGAAVKTAFTQPKGRVYWFIQK